MLSIGATRSKLAEAQFFYAKLADAGRRVFAAEPEAFHYYLSAFLSAARSVGYALQAEQKEKYDAWYPSWEASLPQEQLALLRNFNRERVAAVHKRGAKVSHQVIPMPGSEYLAAASLEGIDIEISGPLGVPLPEFRKVVRTFSFEEAEPEVVQAAGKYLDVVARIVSDFAEHYSGSAAT